MSMCGLLKNLVDLQSQIRTEAQADEMCICSKGEIKYE